MIAKVKEAEGLVVSVGLMGREGRQRSVAFACQLGWYLQIEEKMEVEIVHRDLERSDVFFKNGKRINFQALKDSEDEDDDREKEDTSGDDEEAEDKAEEDEEDEVDEDNDEY